MFRFKTSFWTQLRWVLWRSSIDIFYNPFRLRLSVATSIITAILYGLIYLRLEYDEKAFQNHSAVLLMLIIDISFSQIQKSADVIRLLFDLVDNFMLSFCNSLAL